MGAMLHSCIGSESESSKVCVFESLDEPAVWGVRFLGSSLREQVAELGWSHDSRSCAFPMFYLLLVS